MTNLLYIDLNIHCQGYLYLNSYFEEYLGEYYDNFDLMSFNKNLVYEWRRKFELTGQCIYPKMTGTVPFFSLLKHGSFENLANDYESCGQEYFIPTVSMIDEMVERIYNNLLPIIDNYNVFLLRSYEMMEPLLLYVCMLIRSRCPDAHIIYGDKNNFTDNLFIDVLKNGYIDSVVSGFGEEPLEDIIQKIDRNESYRDCYVGGVPKKKYFPKHDVMFSEGWTGLRTSYACLYNCSFCSNFNQISSSERTIPPREIIEQLKYLKDNHNLTEMTLCDSLFYTTEEELDEFYNGLHENGLEDIFFNLIYIKADLTLRKPELYTRFNGSFLCGMESMCDDVLNIMGKTHTADMNMQVMKIFSKAKREIQCNFIYNHPMETIEMFNQGTRLFPILDKNQYLNVSVNKFRLRANCPVDKNPERYGVEFVYNTDIPKVFDLECDSVPVSYRESDLDYKDGVIVGMNLVSSESNLPHTMKHRTPDAFVDESVLFYRGCDA